MVFIGAENKEERLVGGDDATVGRCPRPLAQDGVGQGGEIFLQFASGLVELLHPTTITPDGSRVDSLSGLLLTLAKLL